MKEPTENFARVYPRILYAGLVVALLLLGVGQLMGLWPGGGSYQDLVFFGVIFGSIPLGLAFALVCRVVFDRRLPQDILWKKPVCTMEQHLEVDFLHFRAELPVRLEAAGFKFETAFQVADCSERWTFKKIKDSNVIAFRDHAFIGEMVVYQETPLRVRATLKMDDIAIIETGEHLALRDFLNELLGHPPVPMEKDIPTTLVQGLCAAIFVMVVAFCGALAGAFPSSVLFTAGLGSLPLILAGLVIIYLKSKVTYGKMLGGLGVLLSFGMIVVGY